MGKILYIEDDAEVACSTLEIIFMAEGWEDYLNIVENWNDEVIPSKKEGYEHLQKMLSDKCPALDYEYNLSGALKALKNNKYDLIIADRNLELAKDNDKDIKDILKIYKKREGDFIFRTYIETYDKKQSPLFYFLTAYNTDDDTLKCQEEIKDIIVVKQFSINDFLTDNILLKNTDYKKTLSTIIKDLDSTVIINKYKDVFKVFNLKNPEGNPIFTVKLRDAFMCAASTIEGEFKTFDISHLRKILEVFKKFLSNNTELKAQTVLRNNNKYAPNCTYEIEANTNKVFCTGKYGKKEVKNVLDVYFPIQPNSSYKYPFENIVHYNSMHKMAYSILSQATHPGNDILEVNYNLKLIIYSISELLLCFKDIISLDRKKIENLMNDQKYNDGYMSIGDLRNKLNNNGYKLPEEHSLEDFLVGLGYEIKGGKFK